MATPNGMFRSKTRMMTISRLQTIVMPLVVHRVGPEEGVDRGPQFITPPVLGLHKQNQENGQIQAQIDKYVTEQRAKIQANNDEVAREKERFTGWRLKKQQEEKKIADAVGYFVSENPITTGPVSVQPPVSKPVQRS